MRDYESISIIGRGGFGEVYLCREKKTGEIVAIKKIKKDVLVEKNEVIHVRNEQLFMSNVKSPWIVELKASFQEGDYLYLVMEYCPGSDLMNVLIKKNILSIFIDGCSINLSIVNKIILAKSYILMLFSYSKLASSFL